MNPQEIYQDYYRIIHTQLSPFGYDINNDIVLLRDQLNIFFKNPTNVAIKRVIEDRVFCNIVHAYLNIMKEKATKKHQDDHSIDKANLPTCITRYIRSRKETLKSELGLRIEADTIPSDVLCEYWKSLFDCGTQMYNYIKGGQNRKKNDVLLVSSSSSENPRKRNRSNDETSQKKRKTTSA